jgi:diacylglycerol O-acyltransferase
VTIDSETPQGWDAAAQWGAEPRMNELEALMWRSERHPELSSTVTGLILLDSTPDWDRLYAAHEWAAQLLPRMRQRVLEPALPVGTPAWVLDHKFHLDYHFRQTRLPGAGGMPELLRFTEAFAIAPLDRTRPLWEAVLVEDLADGRAAYVLKMHHSLTDGIGGIQLLSLVQSRTPEHTPDKPRGPQLDDVPKPDSRQLAIEELREAAVGVPGLASKLLSAGLAGLTQPGTTSGKTLRYVASLRRVLSPPPARHSPVLRPRNGKLWRFGVLECSLHDLRAAGKTAGGSVNDAFIAALLGGLRRYHEEHDVYLDELPMAMPVSLRKSDDPLGGNKFAGAMFAAPMGVADPAERIATIRGIVISLRTEVALDTFSLVAPALNRLPSSLGAAVGRLGASADLSASNVPGVPYDTYMAGAKVERVYPFGPLPGVAVMATMVTHHGVCCIGINLDGSAVKDQAVMMRCLQEGLDEVVALAEA